MRLNQLLKSSTSLTFTFGIFSLIRNMKNQDEINKRLDRIENLIQKTGVLRKSLDEAISARPEQENSIPQETVKDLVNKSNSISEQINELHRIESNIDPNIPTNEDLSTIDTLSDSINKGLDKITEQYSYLIDLITKSSGGKGGSASLIEHNPIEAINNFYSSLSFLETYAIVHLSAVVLIFLSLTSIISIFYGEIIITKLQLTTRFPRLTKIIELRRKFQQFYLITNILTILVVLLAITFVNILILTN